MMKKLMLLFTLLALASLDFVYTEAAAAEPISCMAKYEARSSNTSPAPGTLATRKDTPCRLSINLITRGKGTHQANGFLVLKAPKNGRVDIENASSFVFTPRNGFAGEDLLVIRIKFVNSKGAAVRFVISVD